MSLFNFIIIKSALISAECGLDIKNGKIWIQWNGTEDDIAAELVEMGVLKQDIVLGFHSPGMRQFTDFAVG